MQAAKPTARSSSARLSRERKFSRTQVPADLSPLDWQRALRRQFGQEQTFALENVGADPFFSDFRVGNPQSTSRYRVAIRGLLPGDNFCACPDYATNELGTCKHIEFTLAVLQKKRGGKAAFARGWQPSYSSIFLRYEGVRTVRFRAGSECPPKVLKKATRLFDGARGCLAEERFGELDGFIAAAAGAGHELRAYDDALDFVAGRRDAMRRAETLDRLFPRGASSPAIARSLKPDVR